MISRMNCDSKMTLHCLLFHESKWVYYDKMSNDIDKESILNILVDELELAFSI